VAICSYIASIGGYEHKMLFVVRFPFPLSMEPLEALETIIKFVFLSVKLCSKLLATAGMDVVASLGFSKTGTNQYQPISVVDDDLPLHK
jgi:hypothetical protein